MQYKDMNWRYSTCVGKNFLAGVEERLGRLSLGTGDKYILCVQFKPNVTLEFYHISIIFGV